LWVGSSSTSEKKAAGGERIEGRPEVRRSAVAAAARPVAEAGVRKKN
jgi:hypothetical protein